MYVLHHCKYILICIIDVIVDDFDGFDLFFVFFLRLDNLPSRKILFFLHRHEKLVFCYFHSRFQLNFTFIF